VADNDIQIQVKVDANGAITVLDKLGNEIRRVEKDSDATSGGFGRLERAVITLNQGLDLAGRAFSAISGAASKTLEVISEGSAIADMEESFGRLSAKAGVTADVLLSDLNTATAETISNFDLMKKSNELLQAGLKPDNIIEISKAARVFAEEDGSNMKDTIDELSRSLIRGDDRFLKSKGIIIDNNKAYADFAKTLGISAEKLNEVGKQAAIRQAGLEALGATAARAAKIELDAGDKIENINKVIADSFADIKKQLAGNEGLLKFLGDFANGLKVIIPAAVDIAVKSLSTLQNVLSGTDKEFNIGLDVIKNYALNLPLLGVSLDNYNVSVTQAYGSLKEQNAAQEKVNDATTKGLDPLKLLYGAMGNVEFKATETARTTGTLRDKFIGLGTEAKETAHQMGEVTFSVENANKALQKMNEVAFRGGPSVLDQIFGVENNGSGGGGEAFEKGVDIAGNVLSGIQSAMSSSGKDRTKGIISSLGTTIGSFWGPAGAAIGGMAAEVGNMLGESVHNFFGGKDSKGTEMKKAADKFFAEAFEANRLSIVVNGQLERISDLVFNGNQEGGLFAALPAATQQAFNGVGVAFEGLLDIAGDLGVNIGNVLANNIGGSLNNLQILIERTGISFGELGEQVVTTFLDGELSVKAANDALNSIKQIAEKGIPGALGATAEALESTFASGTKGGAALINNFQDIAHEAKELSIKEFPELMANLEASGKFSSETIAGVFDALKANGIDTIDEFATATTEQLIPVLARLEESGILTEALEKTAELARTINELPSEKTIVLNVKANVSPEAAGVIQTVRTGQSNGMASAS
jgi:hypothetical protein